MLMGPRLVMLHVLVFLCLSSDSVDAVCESGAVQLGSLGRVEYCSAGQWGSICLDSATTPWSEKNAQVVCKQLGYSGALNSVLPNEALVPPEGTPYFLGSVQCLGGETSLDECNSTDVTQCTSARPAAVSCRPRIASEHDVRLVGSPMNGMGAVEIYTSARWISVCPDSGVWTNSTANATCVQLGYQSGQIMTFMLTDDSNIADRQVIDANCTDAFTLQECKRFQLLFTATSPCSAAANMYAGVKCTSSSDAESSVRLFGVSGVNDTEGRVEILYDGKWGTVCEDAFWGLNAGQTVCRELGFTIERVNQVNIHPSGSYAGLSGNRPIWLGRLTCTSTSDALGGCGRLDAAIGSTIHCRSHGLNSADDAAVNCNRTSPFNYDENTTTTDDGFQITQNVVYVSSVALLVLYAIIIKN